MLGQDAHGLSGFRDKVDRHYKRLLGFAVLTGLFAAASQVSQNQNRSVLTYPSPGEVAGGAVGQQMSDLGAQITRKNLNVQPTIKIPVGYRFNVRVSRDVLFDAPYKPMFKAPVFHRIHSSGATGAFVARRFYIADCTFIWILGCNGVYRMKA